MRQTFPQLCETLLDNADVETGTMMGSPCLRFRGEFMAMMFEKADAMIIKVSPERVLSLMEDGSGMEFNYTGKRFKEWVLIPLEFEEQYPDYLNEALCYAQSKQPK